MKKLALTLLLLLSVTAFAQSVVSYQINQFFYVIHNQTPAWAACRVTYPNGAYQDFWLAPRNQTGGIPTTTAWYCELRY